MFTGIIDHTGTITEITETSQALRITIDNQFQQVQLGESIAVDGICLTVTHCLSRQISFDISPETRSLTHCNHYRKGAQVNLERALRLQDRLSGHYVTGHVDKVAQIKHLHPQGEYLEMQLMGFSTAEDALLIPKGSLTVNGVSLTINAIANEDVSPEPILMLIPHTLAITNLKDLTQHATVNIEFDYYAKIIAHQLAHYQSARTVL